MPKLVEIMKKNKLTLLVSLPRNNPELAEAAIKGGADALQLHLHAHGLKGLRSEKSVIADIIKLSNVPVGIAPGNKEQPTQKEVEEIIEMGFDFINMRAENLPSYYSKIKDISKVLALGSRFTIELILGIGKYRADALDAAIIPAAEHGKDLVVGDLQNYISIVISAGIPVIIPTQRSIRPSEVAIIVDTDAKGLLLTPVVLGTTAKHIEQNVREFRVAVDDLG